MGEKIRIKRRISAHPADLGITSTTQPSAVCPDILETESGDFVIIGSDVTSDVGKEIPEDAVISKGERVVLIPRVLLLSAIENLKREDSTTQ